MTERGHAAVELALGVAVLLLPVALAVTAFGPWSERRVLAEAAAAEGARALVIELTPAGAESLVTRMVAAHGLGNGDVRMGWCGSTPVSPGTATGTCPLARGSTVTLTVEVWAPLVMTPWGGVGGLWVRGDHAESIDLYRSIPP